MAAEQFTIDPRIFERIPQLRIGVVVARGIDNTASLDLSKEFAEQETRVLRDFEGIALAQYPVIRAWRDVYKSFGEKKNRSSVEALIRRTLNGKPVGSINALVDLYNLLSLTYEMPSGGEDLDAITEDIELTLADGDESFIPLGGSGEEQNPKPGEIVYRSGKTVLCGSFNYRESDITKITPQTTTVILCVEDILGNDRLPEATEALAQAVTTHLGGTTTTTILDTHNASANLLH